MSIDADTLYAMLPTIHRARDLDAARQLGQATGPLRQLIGLIAEQLTLIEADIDQLYDDQFIETCAPWVVPYLGDLVGYLPIRTSGAAVIPRSEVANTIRWRRAKGALRSIEGVARDVSGRDAVGVEYFRRLAVTQNLNHIRAAVGTVSLRDATAFANPGGPFDTVPRNVTLRPITKGGRWAIPNVACFLWPWRAWPRTNADPAPIDAQRFVFHPFGIDSNLLNCPALEPNPPSLPTALPTRLRLRTPPGTIAASVTVSVGGTPQPFSVCNLADTGPNPAISAWAHMPDTGITIDPERGRIAFAAAPAGPVKVTFWQPSAGLLGGGAYPREAGFDTALRPLLEVGDGAAFPTIAAALASPGFHGTGAIEVASNGRLAAATLPTTITVAVGAKLEIRASDGDFPLMLLGAPLVLQGGAGAELVLDGFAISGAGLQIPATVGATPNGLARVTLRHCTLIPGLALTRAGMPATPGAPSLTSASADTVLVLNNCITGPIVAAPGAQLRISDTIIDAGDPTDPAIAGPASVRAGSLWIYNTTVRGGLAVSLLALASNTLFLGAITTGQRQSGIVRFSAVPPAYVGPRQYSCVGPSIEPIIQSWRLGHPEYARLSSATPAAILRGADDAGQIGAYHGARDAAIEDGVAVRLTENTRIGLASGVLYAQRA
jgi:hypothetical protein